MQAASATAIAYLQKTKIIEHAVEKLLSADHISKALARERQKIFQEQERSNPQKRNVNPVFKKWEYKKKKPKKSFKSKKKTKRNLWKKRNLNKKKKKL
jgi:hypothetical protein